MAIASLWEVDAYIIWLAPSSKFEHQTLLREQANTNTRYLIIYDDIQRRFLPSTSTPRKTKFPNTTTMGNSCSMSGDYQMWGYLDDGKGWTARPKSEYMTSPDYNSDLRRYLRAEKKAEREAAVARYQAQRQQQTMPYPQQQHPPPQHHHQAPQYGAPQQPYAPPPYNEQYQDMRQTAPNPGAGGQRNGFFKR